MSVAVPAGASLSSENSNPRAVLTYQLNSMILEVFSSLHNSDSTLRFLISVGVVRDPLSLHMCQGKDCLDGKALALTGKVKAFGTDLKKNKQSLVSGYPTSPCR